MTAELNSVIKLDGDASGFIAEMHAVDKTLVNTSAETKRFAESLKRNLAKERFGTGTEEATRALAGLKKGVDSTQLEPLFKQLGEARRQSDLLKASFTQSGKAMTEYGMGVKATNAALRQVPAQFTDIIVSLQGGQAPLTVLLQQGGQLKDVFGGVGNAFKALSSYVIGLINPFTLLAAAAGTVGFAYFKGSQEIDAYNKALVMSGNAIGATTGQLKSMAQVASKTTGATIGATSDAVAQLAASGKVATQNMAQFAGLAVKLQREAGIAVGDTVKAFADLAKDPVSASEKLNESTRYLTAEIYNQIKALKDQGDNLGAAALAQRAYGDAMNERLPDLTQNLGLVEKAWRGIVVSAKSAWDAMLGVGRADTATDKINSLRERIADTQKNLAYNPGLFGADLKNMQAELANLVEVERLAKRTAGIKAESLKQDDASIALAKEAEKYATNQVKLQREIAQAKSKYDNSNRSAADLANYTATVNGLVKSLGEKDKAVRTGSKVISEAEKGLKLYNDLMAVSTGLTSNFAEQQALLAAKFAKDGNLDEYRKGMEAIIAKQPYMVAGVRAQTKALQAQQKALDDEIKKIIEQETAWENAKIAADDYLDSIRRKSSRELEGFGKGSKYRSEQSGINAIEDKLTDKESSLSRDLTNKKITEATYKKMLGLARESNAAELALYRETLAEKDKIRINWELGAEEGLANYLDQVADTYGKVEDIFTKAFKGMEDALVDFVTTGKLDFTSLANSILADITRIIVQQNIMGPLAKAVQGGDLGGSFFGKVASELFSADGGGYTGDAPRSGGIDGKGGFMAVLHPQETVVDHTKGQSVSGNTVNVTINQTFAPGTTRATTLQAAADASRQLQYAGRNL